MDFSYINPNVRYLGVSSLRKFNATSLSELRDPVVIKKENGEELVVIVPWLTYLELQQTKR